MQLCNIGTLGQWPKWPNEPSWTNCAKDIFMEYNKTQNAWVFIISIWKGNYSISFSITNSKWTACVQQRQS